MHRIDKIHTVLIASAEVKSIQLRFQIQFIIIMNKPI